MIGSRKWFPAMLAAAGFALLGTPRDAHAILALAADVGATRVYATDGNVNPAGFPPGGYVQIADTDGVVNGQITLANQNIGGLVVNGSFHQATAGTTPGTLNILQSGSSTVTNTTGAAISATVVVGATDFTPPSFEFATSGSGTFTNATGSTIALDWWNDPANRQPVANTGTANTPGNLVDTFNFVAPDNAESFAHNDSGTLAFPDLGLFSMTLRFAFTLTAGGSLTSRGQNEIKPVGIPEPGTLAMAFTALPLMGLGYVRYRRRKAC